MKVREQGQTVCVIDSESMGNISRFINHSCGSAANLKLELVRVAYSKIPRVAIISQRAIESGEELTFDYGVPFDND